MALSREDAGFRSFFGAQGLTVSTHMRLEAGVAAKNNGLTILDKVDFQYGLGLRIHHLDFNKGLSSS